MFFFFFSKVLQLVLESKKIRNKFYFSKTTAVEAKKTLINIKATIIVSEFVFFETMVLCGQVTRKFHLPKVRQIVLVMDMLILSVNLAWYKLYKDVLFKRSVPAIPKFQYLLIRRQKKYKYIYFV